MIFSSRLRPDAPGYGEMAARMEELVRRQPGFLGFESARGEGGHGITVSYWSSLDAVRAWKADREHEGAQARGRQEWYEGYRIRIARVEEERSFG